MKKLYIYLLVLIMLIGLTLISSCSSTPSEQIIQTAIAKTELAATSTPSVTLTPTQDNEKQQIINDVLALFKIGTAQAYTEAYDNHLRIVGSATGKYWNDEEIQTLREFALDMSFIMEGNNYSDAFAGISPDYNGVYYEEISAEVLKHISKDEWYRRYNKNLPLKLTSVAKARVPAPQIGMTAQQVLDSQWGKPLQINKTTTANSVSEQWVYGNGRYVYLENGIVTAIQE